MYNLEMQFMERYRQSGPNRHLWDTSILGRQMPCALLSGQQNYCRDNQEAYLVYKGCCEWLAGCLENASKVFCPDKVDRQVLKYFLRLVGVRTLAVYRLASSRWYSQVSAYLEQYQNDKYCMFYHSLCLHLDCCKRFGVHVWHSGQILRHNHAKTHAYSDSHKVYNEGMV